MAVRGELRRIARRRVRGASRARDRVLARAEDEEHRRVHNLKLADQARLQDLGERDARRRRAAQQRAGRLHEDLVPAEESAAVRLMALNCAPRSARKSASVRPPNELRGALGDLVRVEEADDDRALALGEGDGLAHRLERLRGRADAGDEEVGDRRIRPRPRVRHRLGQLAAEEAERRAAARPLRRHAEALAQPRLRRRRRARASPPRPLRRQRERRRQRRVQRRVRLGRSSRTRRAAGRAFQASSKLCEVSSSGGGGASAAVAVAGRRRGASGPRARCAELRLPFACAAREVASSSPRRRRCHGDERPSDLDAAGRRFTC